MLDSRGEPHLIDFGLARRHESLAESDEDVQTEPGADGRQTRAGAIMGTPAYMSPEQTEDSSQAGPAADQYSLGVTLYELLCGQTPFAGIPWPNVIYPIRNEAPFHPGSAGRMSRRTWKRSVSRRWPRSRRIAIRDAGNSPRTCAAG